MAIKTFTRYVHSQSSGTTDYATLNRKFGDGYGQITEDGLNNVAQSWNTSTSGTGTEIKEIRNFLDRYVGVKSFLWTPPLSELGFYQGTAPSISGGGGSYYTLTTTFTRTCHP